MFQATSTRHFVLAQMLLAVILANMNPIFSKTLFAQGWSPLMLYFTILVVVNVVLLVHESIALERGVRWGMTRTDIIGILLTTATGGIISPILFFTGLQHVTASEAVILTSMLPFFVVLFSILLLKERFTGRIVVGGTFLTAGVAMILLPDLQSGVRVSPGVFLLLCSSVAGALTTVVHKKFVVHRHLDSVVLMRTLLSLVFITCWIAVWQPEGFRTLGEPVNMWLVLAVPVVCYIFPFFLFFRSLRSIKAIDAGIVEAAGRVFAVIAASVIFREQLTSLHLASLLLVIFGFLFINVPLGKWRVVPSRLLELGPLRK